jgi:hypothetical protein
MMIEEVATLFVTTCKEQISKNVKSPANGKTWQELVVFPSVPQIFAVRFFDPETF